MSGTNPALGASPPWNAPLQLGSRTISESIQILSLPACVQPFAPEIPAQGARQCHSGPFHSVGSGGDACAVADDVTDAGRMPVPALELAPEPVSLQDLMLMMIPVQVSITMPMPVRCRCRRRFQNRGQFVVACDVNVLILYYIRL